MTPSRDFVAGRRSRVMLPEFVELMSRPAFSYGHERWVIDVNDETRPKSTEALAVDLMGSVVGYQVTRAWANSARAIEVTGKPAPAPTFDLKGSARAIVVQGAEWVPTRPASPRNDALQELAVSPRPSPRRTQSSVSATRLDGASVSIALRRIAVGLALGSALMVGGIALAFALHDWRLPVLMVMGGLGLIWSGIAFALEVTRVMQGKDLAAVPAGSGSVRLSRVMDGSLLREFA